MRRELSICRTTSSLLRGEPSLQRSGFIRAEEGLPDAETSLHFQEMERFREEPELYEIGDVGPPI